MEKHTEDVFMVVSSSKKGKDNLLMKWGLDTAKKGDVYGLEVIKRSGNSVSFNFKKI